MCTRNKYLISALALSLAIIFPHQVNAYGDIVRCESSNGDYNHCRADTRGGVALRRQLSRDGCWQGRSWGYDRGGIWVDNGCRAEFQVGRGTPDYSRPRKKKDDDSKTAAIVGGVIALGAIAALMNSNDNSTSSADTNGIVRCESDGGYHYCRANTSGGVKFQRQLGRASCAYKSTWGYDGGGVWVDRGCRGEFAVQ